MTTKLVKELFDDLSLEVYYGFNMKVELLRADVNEIAVIRKFVDRCKEEREKVVVAIQVKEV